MKDGKFSWTKTVARLFSISEILKKKIYLCMLNKIVNYMRILFEQISKRMNKV